MNELIIRDAVMEDAEGLLKIYSYYVKNTAISMEYEAPDQEVFMGRMRDIMKKYPYIIAEKDGRIIGYAHARAFVERTAYDTSCETTIYLDHEAVKCGLGKKLYEELERRLKAMGILNLYACISYADPEDEYVNNNSRDFHKHMGFTQIAAYHRCCRKFGRWYDVIWMEKMIGDHKDGV